MSERIEQVTAYSLALAGFIGGVIKYCNPLRQIETGRTKEVSPANIQIWSSNDSSGGQ